MSSKSDDEPRVAKHGEKTIELSLRFWTDEISGVKGTILPKHAWASGVVNVVQNASHGIKPADPIPFNSLLELPVAIEKALLRHKIVLHPDGKMKKYFEAT